MELGTSGSPFSLETDYSYDPLDNLTWVNQHGTAQETARLHSFCYDSISRLLVSTNPESGTICYGQWNGGNCVNGYDGNGNLRYKTDANGTVMSYSYDPLKRLTNEVASDGSYAATLYYDVPPSLWGGTPFACSNGIGRLCQADHVRYSGTAFNYDPLGRTSSTLYGSITSGPLSVRHWP